MKRAFVSVPFSCLSAARFSDVFSPALPAADVPVTMVSRYDLNIASGIIHTIKEYEATDIVIGLHRKANIVDSFFGHLAESLLKGTHREVLHTYQQ